MTSNICLFLIPAGAPATAARSNFMADARTKEAPGLVSKIAELGSTQPIIGLDDNGE
ncbi:MAG: hypothetical protein KDA53_05095 [Hyphomonas sp.]|nr:hypothetical protein [Hyphomonas sp.]